jgi:hypothetical protein
MRSRLISTLKAELERLGPVAKVLEATRSSSTIWARPPHIFQSLGWLNTRMAGRIRDLGPGCETGTTSGN